jgi:hypothetical protein
MAARMKLPRIPLAALLLSSAAIATNNILTAEKLEADIRTDE